MEYAFQRLFFITWMILDFLCKKRGYRASLGGVNWQLFKPKSNEAIFQKS